MKKEQEKNVDSKAKTKETKKAKIKEETVQENKEFKKEENTPKKKSKIRLIIVLMVAALASIVGYVMFRGTYLETLEIGENYINVFWQNLKYMAITLGVNFAVIYMFIYFANIKIKNGLKPFFEQENKQMPKLINKSIAFVSAILISAVTSNMILEKVMLCINSTQFGITDPIFGLDLGYFIFQKPFIELVFWYLIIALLSLTIYTVIYYIISFNRFFDGVDRKTLKNSKLIKQLIRNVMILAILIAGIVLVKTQDIETEKFITLTDETSTYSLYGAGFTDVTIKLWGYRILSAVIIVSIYIAIKAFKEGKIKKLIFSVSAVPIYLLGMFIVLLTYQTVFVNTNELDKEKDYIANNIKFTKNAYGINIEEISLKDAQTITSQEINTNQDVIRNIAIVNKDVVLKDLKSSQTAKGYYSFRDTQIAKYNINGLEQLVYVSPREIVSSNGTYNNKTYEYTHGYGAILTSATSTKENGNLDNIQKSFENTNESVTIVEPRIYFGTQTNDTVVTNSKDKKEFDYPVLNSNTAENMENIYKGTAGLSLNFIDRIILSIKEGDLKLAFSGNITNESKILTNRNITKRAETVMPYLTYDENPYMVITEDGKLVWVLDAYTTSNAYPYSQKTTIQKTATNKLELNYIRNSVKVIIDSYDGTTKFYITDRTDPIAMAYYNIYPDLFVNLDEQIPADICSHFVYPEYLYNIQSEIIARYHNVQPDVLYRNDDVWKIATSNTGKVLTKTGTEISPYYTMLKTINDNSSELGLVLPYTPYEKQSLISYLVGTYDNSGNSKLTIYKYSADSNILGPMQLDTQIEQDETISKELETLNVNGTKIIKNMIIVPINSDLLYIEPIYQQYINETNALPTLKKVIVASGNKVAIGDNLKNALTNLVSQYAVDIEVENTDTIQDLINTIIKANNNLTTSNNSNDWEMTGKDIKKLQELISKLEILVDQENKNKAKLEEQNSLNEIDANNITANNEVV